MKQFKELTDPKKAIPSFHITVSLCSTPNYQHSYISMLTFPLFFFQLEDDNIFAW